MAICCSCEETIEPGEDGRSWDDGLAYCFRCEKGQPRCLWCRRPVFEAATTGTDKVICVYCAHRFPQCDRCGELIHGSCTTYLEKTYCRACGEKYPLCLDCGQAIDQGAECGVCHGPARACAGCGSLFADKWQIHDQSWWCTPCYWKATGRCRFCQEARPRVRDNACLACLGELVREQATARELLDEVQWFCTHELGLTVTRPYELRLAANVAAIPKLHTDAYMLSLNTVGLWSFRDRVMWAVQGYPAWFTAVVLAHEHAHAWQAENCPLQSEDVMEGFASWVEWRVAHSLGKSVFADNMVKMSCPIYGRGLRRCLELEKRLGPAALVEKMRTMQAFSAWTSFSTWLKSG